MIKYYSAVDLMENGNALAFLPSWVSRIHDDVWPCAIQLKNGTNIDFDTLMGIEIDGHRKETWLHLANRGNYDVDSENKYLEIEGSERGVRVLLSQVAAFWERADT